MLQKSMANMFRQELRYMSPCTPKFVTQFTSKTLRMCTLIPPQPTRVDIRVGCRSNTHLLAHRSTSFHRRVDVAARVRILGLSYEMRSSIHPSADTEQKLEGPMAEPCGPIAVPRVWEGLATWRSSGVCENRIWGPVGPESPASDSTGTTNETAQEAFNRVSDVAGRGRVVRDSAVCSAAGMPPGIAQPIGEDREPSRWATSCADLARDGHEVAHSDDDVVREVSLPPSLAECGRMVLLTSDPKMKAELTHTIFKLWAEGKLPLGTASAPDQPARPTKPELIPPRSIPQPGSSSPLPPAAHMLHNLAHVELNAVDLAWDTVVRFSGQQADIGEAFYSDFARVADDESRHLSWCLQRLEELGSRYGDMPAHNLLWRDCAKSSGSVDKRLVLIPITQEARGLDAGPRVAERLRGLGDLRSASIVSRISEEELAHVAVGVDWFLRLCTKTGKAPGEAFEGVLKELSADGVRGPFNHTARAQAGLPRHWYDSGVDLRAKKGEQRHLHPHAIRAEKAQLEHKVQRMETRAYEFEKRLENSVFMARAPAGAVASAVEVAQKSKKGLEEIRQRLAVLVAMECDNNMESA